MSIFIGDRASMGVGREATRGTGVAAALWIPAVSFDFQQKINSQNIAGAYGKIIGTETSKIMQLFGQGTIGMDVRANAIGYFLTQLFGDVDSTLTASGVYTHTYNLTHSNQHPTLSLYIKDPNKSERFLRSALETLMLKFTPEGVATTEVGFMSEPAEDSAAVADFSTADYVFAPSTVSMKIATTQSGLAGASAVPVNNFEVNFKKGADPDFASGSNSPSDIYNTALEVTGSFERVFDSDTEHDYVFTNLTRAVRFAMLDANVNLGGGNNPALTIDLYNVTFTEFSREIQLGNITRQKVGFTAHLNIADGNVMTATLVNSKANYSS